MSLMQMINNLGPRIYPSEIPKFILCGTNLSTSKSLVLGLWGIPHLWGMASYQVGNFVHLFPPNSVLCRLSFVTGV